jgi:hypothetical protein
MQSVTMEGPVYAVIAPLPPVLRNEGFVMSACAAHDLTPKMLPVNEGQTESA